MKTLTWPISYTTCSVGEETFNMLNKNSESIASIYIKKKTVLKKKTEKMYDSIL